MDKQNKKNIWIIVGLILVIAIISRMNPETFSISSSKSDTPTLPFGVSSYNQPATATNQLSYNSIDFCSVYTDNYPTSILSSQTLCSGIYLCQHDKIGCYSISNTNQCDNYQIKLLERMCSGIDGKWTCNSNQISCDKQ